MISLQPWTNRMSKMTQPNLDYIGKNIKMSLSFKFINLSFDSSQFVNYINNLVYIAPEIQQKKEGGFYSDMYSFGMTICAIFNQGRPLIQANHNCSDYLKQVENVSNQIINQILTRNFSLCHIFARFSFRYFR